MTVQHGPVSTPGFFKKNILRVGKPICRAEERCNLTFGGAIIANNKF
jgi:hypothetical protein